MIKGYLFGGVVAVMFLMTFVLYSQYANDDLGFVMDNETALILGDVYNNAERLNNETHQNAVTMSENAPGGIKSGGQSVEGTRSDIINQNSINILSVLPATYDLVFGMMNSIANILHVPNFIIYGLVSLILIGITLWIVGLISGNIGGGGA